jgi:ribonuclease H2 subunit A
VYVDALGTTTTYETYLSNLFPGINFTVTTKADSKFKIVGAASVAAKVTRDACIDGWVFQECDSEKLTTGLWSTKLGSGYPSGKFLLLEHFPQSLFFVDPTTQAWLKDSIEPTFGFPSLVRFSWTTIKVLLEKSAHSVQWYVHPSLNTREVFC